MMNSLVDFKAFRKDLDKAMEEVGKKYNITLKSANITYGENEFSVKVEAKRADIDVDRENFVSLLRSFNELKEEDYLKKIEIEGKSLTIVGLKPRCKYSVLLRSDNGQTYAYTYDGVLKALGRR